MSDKMGKLIVIEGPLRIEFIEHEEDLTEPFLPTNIIIPDAYLIADARTSQSKRNKLLTYKVYKHREDGYDVVLGTRKLEYLDKRLRHPDVVIRLGHID